MIQELEKWKQMSPKELFIELQNIQMKKNLTGKEMFRLKDVFDCLKSKDNRITELIAEKMGL